MLGQRKKRMQKLSRLLLAPEKSGHGQRILVSWERGSFQIEAIEFGNGGNWKAFIF